MHWRAQGHAKCPRGSRGFQHATGFESMLSYSLLLTSTTKPWVHINLLRRTEYDESYLATLNCFFACRIQQDCHPRIAQVEYQGRTRYTRILDLKPFVDTYYSIQHRLDLKFPHFTYWHFFCAICIEQLMNLNKKRTENLNFGTDLQDQDMDCRSATQSVIIFKGRLPKKSSNWE